MTKDLDSMLVRQSNDVGVVLAKRPSTYHSDVAVAINIGGGEVITCAGYHEAIFLEDLINKFDEPNYPLSDLDYRTAKMSSVVRHQLNKRHPRFRDLIVNEYGKGYRFNYYAYRFLIKKENVAAGSYTSIVAREVAKKMLSP